MKRVRLDQIQGDILEYLKKRNFTDSETTFKSNFKFEESLAEHTCRQQITSSLSENNTVVMTPMQLEEYFTLYDSFQEFVYSQGGSLINLLHPVFVYFYLELSTSGRNVEAKNFYTRFYRSDFENDATLHGLSKEMMASKAIDIPNTNKTFCRVELNENERNMLFQFLQQHGSLLLLKIINQRIQISDDNNFDITPQDLKKRTKKPSEIENNASKMVLKSSPVVERTMITPPSLTTTPNQVPVKAPSEIKFDIDVSSLNKKCKRLAALPPSIPDVCLYEINSSEIDVISTCLSNSRSSITIGREDGLLKVWDIQRKGTNNTLSFKGDMYGHMGPVYALQYTSNDDYIITASEDSTLRLWDAEKMKNNVIYRGHNYPVWCLAVSPLSMYFVSGSHDATAKLWTTERTFPLRSYAGHQNSVECVGFHPNSTYLATADHTVRLWDVNSGKTVRLMLGHLGSVKAMAFSPDGKWLATSGEDCRIRVWDIASGNLFKQLLHHTDTVYALSYSHDGSVLTSCGLDSRLCVWNLLANDTASHLISKWDLSAKYKLLSSTCFDANNLLHCVAVEK